ncbi:MAG: CatB-related O-acetyltransferase [Bdellovibrio sp.]
MKRVKLGVGNRIEKGVFLSKSHIGSYNYIGHYSIIDKTKIGNYCSIAAHTMIGGSEHPYQWWSMSFRLCRVEEKPLTVIEDDVWIGTKATIRRGVRVGRGAVIGSHAVVLEDVPPYAIVVGTPAKILKYRLSSEQISKLEQTKYWELNPEDAKARLSSLDR